MNTENLVPINVLCTHYRVEMSFFSSLEEIGLVDLEAVENTKYIPSEKLGDVEKILRMQQDLNLNLEAIDIVFHLLDKVNGLQSELQSIKSRLRIYEE
ncbi:chaperone modulator CbpM [Persicitalea sp.]|uniref:chaperone modulator CbpM n=1 Tax=Persicitalea sp. TaxID=3100273 RepID=UPI003593C8D3